jgi:hypothetical protein
MPDKKALSLHILPVEMFYRILDDLDDKALYLLIRNTPMLLATVITGIR